MSVQMEEPDDFERYCAESNINTEEERRNAFPIWVQDTTGWDGMQFSLTEDERFWITRANEIIEWLRLVNNQEPDGEALRAAFRCLASLKPIPKSLTVE